MAKTKDMIPVIKYYVLSSMLYLVLGSFSFVGILTGYVPLNMVSFYIMELYGFVGMMIFGASYMFGSAFSPNSEIHSLSIAKYELVILNLSIILLTLSIPTH